MSTKTATVIGATGLIGSYLVKLLQTDDYFQTVRLLVRRPVATNDPKTEVKLIDFKDEESYKLGINESDVVFCAVGTTQQKVKGDKEAYRKVDYDIPVKAAQFCKETGCSVFLLVSSVGASSKNSNFYLKLKGEAEDGVKETDIKSVSVFRPSILLGERNENRPGETIGKVFMQFFSFALINNWKKYRPIHAKEVAAAMLQAAKKVNEGFAVYEYDEIKRLAAIKPGQHQE
ncbi:MAG: NAD(P)H-binding protein [Chitinophagaceae bacterium]